MSKTNEQLEPVNLTNTVFTATIKKIVKKWSVSDAVQRLWNNPHIGPMSQFAEWMDGGR